MSVPQHRFILRCPERWPHQTSSVAYGVVHNIAILFVIVSDDHRPHIGYADVSTIFMRNIFPDEVCNLVNGLR